MDNVASMPTDWWAWDGDRLTALGICEDFDEACDKGAALHFPQHWIFSRESLEFLKTQIEKELK